MKETARTEETYSVTVYRASVGLPSILELDRTGTSNKPWTPIVNHRVSAQCELIYVVGGSGRMAVQDRWFDAREHTVVFIPTGIPLDLVSQENNKFDLVYTHFHMRDDHHYRRMLGPAQYILHELETYDDEAYLNMLALPDVMHLEPGNRVFRYLESAIDVYEAKTLGYYQETCALLLGALHQLQSTLVSAVSYPKGSPKSTAAALARRVRSYVLSHVETFSGMGELGDAFRMNSQHLSRVFKTVYGENIVNYVNRLRIEAAKRNLTNTEMSVAKVAKASGFKTTNHFQRVFRQEVGLSPLEFRSHRAMKTSPSFTFRAPADHPVPISDDEE